MILDRLDIGTDSFAAGTGWAIKPEGACKGEVCVPLPSAPTFDLVATAQRLGMALVHDEAHGIWALGPESLTGRTLVSAEAPDVALQDICVQTTSRPKFDDWSVSGLDASTSVRQTPHGVVMADPEGNEFCVLRSRTQVAPRGASQTGA